MTTHRDLAARREDRPRHPTKQAVWLLIGVTVLLVALAVASSTGHL